MKYFLLVSLLIFFIGFSSVYGLPPLPPTNFVVTLTDEKNNMVETPAYLQIDEILNGETLQSYRLDLLENPQSISMPWYVPNQEEKTEIHIVAVKQGFENSDKFVFTITSRTPTEGTLFEHTFVLKTAETSKIVDKDYSVTLAGKSFNIPTKSSSNIQSIEFLETENTVSIIVNEESISGFTDLTIPTGLISPPFKILLDDVAVFPSEESTGKETKLHLEYTNGVHSIRVISPIEATVPSGEEVVVSGSEEKPVKTEEREMEETIKTKTSEENGGGCLIATATYGSELAPQVQQLRELRDNSLLKTSSGTSFMLGFNQIYYSFSPAIADFERENAFFKETVKLAITPLLTSLSILNYIDMDSEESVLGYGIGIILLNIGMYFVAPAILIQKIRNKI